MTASTGVRENAAALAKEIRRAGVKATPYQRNPLYGTPSTTFSLAIDHDVVRVWAGTARVKVIPAGNTIAEQGLKQAVLQVFEPARRVQQVVNLNYRQWRDNQSLADMRRHMGRWDLRRALGVNMPEGTTYTITAFDRKDVTNVDKQNDWSGTDFGTFTVRASTKATHQNFLVGKDEKSQFVSALPRKATSVRDAHDSLRPAGVPKTAARQGEWFFVPATQVEKAKIKKAVEARGLHPRTIRLGGRYTERFEVGHLEPFSSHRAPCQITVDNRLYVTGVVYDSRKNHHGSLNLSDWHRVIRNRELVNVAAAGGGGGRWD